MADIFISSPQRAVVKIKSMTAGPAARILSGARMQMEAVRREFEGQVRCILLLFGQKSLSDSVTEDDWLEIIEVSGDDAPVDAALDIRDRLFGSLPAERLAMLSSEELADTLQETGPLAGVLVSFRTRISRDAFRILRLEAENLNREYESGHYTTSALCVGRMLEFVVYTLAKDWRVPINKRTIGLLRDLQDRFNRISRLIIDYAYADAEQEKEVVRDELSAAIKEFNERVARAPSRLHEDREEKIDTKLAINIEPLLKDVQRKHGEIEVVNKEIRFLLKSNLIRSVLDMRNRAAHADTSGGRTEYDKHDIDGVIDNLRAILVHLGNIADTVDRDAK